MTMAAPRKSRNISRMAGRSFSKSYVPERPSSRSAFTVCHVIRTEKFRPNAIVLNSPASIRWCFHRCSSQYDFKHNVCKAVVDVPGVLIFARPQLGDWRASPFTYTVYNVYSVFNEMYRDSEPLKDVCRIII